MVGNTKSSVKNSLHFKELLNNIKVEESDVLAGSDIVNLFTNFLVDEVLEVIENRLKDDRYLNECYARNVDSIIESLEISLKTSYFRFGDKFFQQKCVLAMCSSL